MQRRDFQFVRIFGLLIFSWLAFCGLADIELDDVQTAVIEQDYEKAQRLAENFLAGNPEKSQWFEAEYYLGLSKLYLQKYAEARAAFEKILAAGPSRGFADRAGLGIIDSYMLDGDFENALKLSQKLLADSPRSEFLSLIYFKIGRAHFKLAHWEEATKFLEIVIDRFADSPEAHLARQLLEEKHYFAVQIGSFRDQGLAERLVADMRAEDKYAYIVETVDKGGQKFFRVRVGQFSRLDQALAMARKLSQLGYPTLIYP